MLPSPLRKQRAFHAPREQTFGLISAGVCDMISIYEADGRKGVSAMKNEPIRGDLPPVIRVFLSSTFADMEKERSYFNEVLVPQLNRICAERGVSFFSVDLRWGITEEDQVNGKVLPICLSEIDKCRPFFIGILGSRYGSVMESVPDHVAKTIPWLVGKEGRSITELEMLYAVLDQETGGVTNCSFYLRDDALSAQWYGPAGQDPRLQALRTRIREEKDIPSTDYADLESFGQAVMGDILRWLDREFPVPEQVSLVRRAWYDRELLRNYIHIPQMHNFLDAYRGESQKSLLIYGTGARGKTTLLTAWKPQEGKKILVNCGSDDAFLYWPAIAREIIQGLREISDDVGLPNMKAGASAAFRMLQAFRGEGEASRPMDTDFFFVTEQEQEDFRVEFLAWLEKLRLPEPVYIVLNDLNLLEDERAHLLAWLPASAQGNVRFICSTNSPEMVDNAENLGWNCKEMPPFPREYAGDFIDNYLHAYGKNLAAEQRNTLLASAITAYPGQLRFVADFLIDRGRFENLSRLIAGVAAQTEPWGVYRYAYDFFAAELEERERAAVRAVFGLLRCAEMSLNEPECFRLAQTLTGVTAMEWAKIRSIFERFELIRGDYWNMREPELERFVDALLSPEEMNTIGALLGDDMLRRLHADDRDSTGLHTIRENTAFAKAALFHYRSSGCWEKLRGALMDHAVLHYLSRLERQAVRVGWMELFLHTDADISEPLFELLERYRDAEGDDRSIAWYVAGLFFDLEQRPHLERVYRIMGTREISSTLNRDQDRIGPSFAKLYDAMHNMKARGQFRQLLAQADRALAMKYPFKPIELCQILFFKADSESHLQLFREFLDTANRYYTTAIQAASLYDICRSLSLRGDALYRVGRYSEAAQVQRQVSRLALRDGDLRSWLASRNILGMCLYREKKYAESVAEFEDLCRLWTRLGETREAANVMLNKCNALSFSGDNRAALETAAACRDQLPADREDLRDIRLSMLSNMGAYALSLGEYAAAEDYLLQAVREAEALGRESSLVRSRFSLIRLYEQTDRFMMAVEQYQQQMELLWERRAYRDVTKSLKEAVLLLHANKYAPMARDLQAKWEARFNSLEGGREFFEQQVRAGVTDAQAVERARERLALARSEGDLVKTAQAYRELARELESGSRDESLDALLEAANTFRQAGQDLEGENCLCIALVLLFENGKPYDRALYAKVLDLIRDPAVRDIASLWEQVGNPGKKSIPELLGELAAYSTERGNMVLRCLLDVTRQMAEHCTAEQILDLVSRLSPQEKAVLASRLDSVMLEHNQRDIDSLTKDYRSPEAERKLAYYEKCVQVLEPLGSVNIGAVVGNLALIFRRREDQEKTLRYHIKATELYKKAGKIRDYLIELLNSATAFEKFGQTQQAIHLLREGMAEAAAVGEKRMEASMAGNLAAFLSRSGEPGDQEEILACFAIEERYFRETGSQRDLVISLLNQILYLRKIGADWSAKIAEAGRLVRAGGFREFEQTLSKLEWLAKQERASGQTLTADQAAEQIQALLEPGDVYQVKELSEENGAFHAVCYPKQGSKTEAELLHLFLDPAQPGWVQAVFLCQPAMVGKNAADTVEKYVAWWNAQGSYRLSLRRDGMILQANCAIAAADQSQLPERFGWYCRLWQADKSAMSMMCLGMSELSLYQGMKLKVFNEGQ